MDIIKDSPRVSRLEVVETGRRRRWSLEKKLEIVEGSFAAPRMAASTARRHGIAPSLLFAWRKAYREGRLGGEAGGGSRDAVEQHAETCFVPAVIVPHTPDAESSEPAPLRKVSRRGEPARKRKRPGQMTVMCANGRRVIVGPDVDETALERVLAVLERT